MAQTKDFPWLDLGLGLLGISLVFQLNEVSRFFTTSNKDVGQIVKRQTSSIAHCGQSYFLSNFHTHTILPDLNFTIMLLTSSLDQTTNTVFTNIFQLKKKTKLLIGQSWFLGPLKNFAESKKIITNIGENKIDIHSLV